MLNFICTTNPTYNYISISQSLVILQRKLTMIQDDPQDI